MGLRTRMYTLISRVWYDDADAPTVKPVANFTSRAKALKYVQDVTLEVYPNGSRKFRRDSLLSGAATFDIEETPEPLEVDPQPPAEPPQKEYIVVLKERDGRNFRVLCRKQNDAAKELEWAKRIDSEAYIEERLI